jgi:hypothetical protein
LDGAVISGLTLPAPISEDVHIRVPNLSGFLYDGSEIISVDADEIFGSVGIGTTSGAGADGIGSQSATGSLLASKTGAAGIDIAPLVSGSSYILGGSTVFGPLTPGSLSLAGDPLFADRGLIQVYINPQGQSEAAYRVQKFPDGTDPLDLGFAEIVDISDSHATTLAGFDLVFDGTDLSWARGEPVVPVVGETHRLFCSDYSGWIDVKIASAPGAAGQDKYRVLASKKNAGGLLLGHAFWDGAAISPVTDRRYFGNIAGSDFTDSTKTDLRSDVVELRSNMVYSGGAVTFGLPGIAVGEVRVSGPLVAYVGGRRFEVPLAFGTDSVISGKGGYSGIAMPFASNFLYVDGSGVFQVASAWPAGDHARIAEVTIASGTVSGVVDARLARFAFTDTDILEWSPDSGTLSVLAAGSIASSKISVGAINTGLVDRGALASGSLDIGTGANTSSIQLGDAVTTATISISSAGTLSLESDTGNATLASTAGNIIISSDTGDVALSSISGSVTLTSVGDSVFIGSFLGGLSLSAGLPPGTPPAGSTWLVGRAGVSIFAGDATPPAPVDDDVVIQAESGVAIGANSGITIESPGIAIASQALSAGQVAITNIGDQSLRVIRSSSALSVVHRSIEMAAAYSQSGGDVTFSGTSALPVIRLLAGKYHFKIMLFYRHNGNNGDVSVNLNSGAVAMSGSALESGYSGGLPFFSKSWTSSPVSFTSAYTVTGSTPTGCHAVEGVVVFDNDVQVNVTATWNGSGTVILAAGSFASFIATDLAFV